MAITFAAVDKQKAMKAIYNQIFPEDAGNDADYVKRAAAMFERLRGIELTGRTVTDEGQYVRRSDHAS